MPALRWFELSGNPDAVRNHYSDPPDLSPFLLREIFLYGHDATLTLAGELSRPPDSSIKDQSAVASLSLIFWNVLDLSQNGVLVDCKLKVELTQNDKGNISISADGSGSTLSATCRCFDIYGFGVYSDDYVQQNRKTLLAYHNVWNSCLISLCDAGYELELIGEPDPNGYASHCGWRATRDGVVLEAGNPTELLGLAGLHQNATKSIDEDYWWRVDGPNLTAELEDAWWRKWHGEKPRDQPD